jgi:hypothetical protein
VRILALLFATALSSLSRTQRFLMARSSSGRRSEIFRYTRSHISLSYSVVFKIPPKSRADLSLTLTRL